MDTPLNVAHRHRRQADILLRAGKFNEAIGHHSLAEKALSEVVIVTNSAHILQSLKLQLEYHKRQKAVIQKKKKLANEHDEYQNRVKEMRMKAMSTLYTSHLQSAQLLDKVLHYALGGDSLVNFLPPEQCEGLPSREDVQTVEDFMMRYVKAPKDDKLKLEELRIGNEALKQAMVILMTDFDKVRNDLENARKENNVLKAVIGKRLNSNRKFVAPPKQNTGQSLYPPVFLSLNNNESMCDLPALEPVEIPKHFNSKAIIDNDDEVLNEISNIDKLFKK